MADIVISIFPSYWADIPGQFIAFIDRCTPWCNTHEAHASIGSGKKGYSIALRTGPSMRECDRIIQSIEHFYGHMEIECCDGLGLCSVDNKETLIHRKNEIIEFVRRYNQLKSVEIEMNELIEAKSVAVNFEVNSMK